jgi:putative MFS transporter
MTIDQTLCTPDCGTIGANRYTWGSSILAAIGIYMFQHSNRSDRLIAAAVIFGLGVCFNWPTVIGFVAQRVPSEWRIGDVNRRWSRYVVDRDVSACHR